MQKKNSFKDWYDQYFRNQQDDDSPYTYEDIVESFNAGYQEGNRKG